MAICEDRILITQYTNCVLIYELNGLFVSRIGRGGNGKLAFNLPFDLTIDESNGDVYICDYNNNRVQVLLKGLSFKSQFGGDILHSPRDVKLSKEYIFVIVASNPCLHLFDYNHSLQYSVLSRGPGMQVINPWYFFIDLSDHIHISDAGSNSILIFNPEIQLIHKISVSNNPTGIAVDKQGRIIVVSHSDKHC